jgi:hypothetical protein
MAEGVGFEPTVTFLPRSISSRVPSTGLSHPSFLISTACSTAAVKLDERTKVIPRPDERKPRY